MIQKPKQFLQCFGFNRSSIRIYINKKQDTFQDPVFNFLSKLNLLGANQAKPFNDFFHLGVSFITNFSNTFYFSVQ